MFCKPESVSIGVLVQRRNVINDSPAYQRESGVWSVERQQLFLDSLFNRFDIPKLYFDDLRGKRGRYDWAVIDGKQRLNTIWDFADGKVALADDFKLYDEPDPGRKQPPIPGGSRFADLSEHWKEEFKNISISVTMVEEATEDDIEELFSRLNNGEPLSAAEKRNARAGAMNELIREVAKHKFFVKHVSFSNKRYQFLEVAAKFVLIEDTARSGKDQDPFCDLKKKFLDKLVEENKALARSESNKLLKQVNDGLNRLCRLFAEHDPLLSKQAYPPMYYLFARLMDQEYGHKNLFGLLKRFIPEFQKRRLANLSKPEGEQDAKLIEFGRLIQQGTNDLNSLRDRVSILRRYFLADHPDVDIKDRRRQFTHEERWVIWVRAEKKCQKCSQELPTLEAMQADHFKQHAHGGATSLANARCLCANCNGEARERPPKPT